MTLLGALLVAGSLLTGQVEANIKNPSAVTFTPSADHALVESYELDLLRADGSVLQTLNVGKPPVVLNVCTVSINVQPVAFGVNYSARLRATAGTATSDYTVSINKFDRAPGAPTNVIIK